MSKLAITVPFCRTCATTDHVSPVTGLCIDCDLDQTLETVARLQFEKWLLYIRGMSPKKRKRGNNTPTFPVQPST